MELELWQILVVGAVASVLVQGLRLLGARLGVKFTKAVIGWVSAGVALVITVIFKWDELPSLVGDPMEVVTRVSVYVGVIVGWATLVYNILFEKLLDGVGLSVKKFLARYV